MTVADRDSLTAPTYTKDEVAKHDSADDAWVIIRNQVYDVSKFLSDHPGGASIVLEYAGGDATEAFTSPDIHEHSKAAFRMLRRYWIGHIVGTVAIGRPEDASCPVDLSRGILSQVASLGEKYEAWVHEPLDEPVYFSGWRPFTGAERHRALPLARLYHERVRIFDADFSEFFSRTPWFGIPVVWGPIIYLLLQATLEMGIHTLAIVVFVALGIIMWTFAEYMLHRFLFHMNVRSPLAVQLHFLLHGVHHLTPMDGERLVFPPVPGALIVSVIFSAFGAMLSRRALYPVTAGFLLGYAMYDLVHYYLHHARPLTRYMRTLKSYHLDHHYKNFELGYGITSKLWDSIFGTVLA